MASTQAASLRLAPVLDIAAAAPLVAELLKLRGHDLVVDASGVERLGAQCVQALLSATATWSQDGMEFEVVDPSPVFGEGLAIIGLEMADLNSRNH